MIQQNFDFLKKINHESGGSLFVGRRKTKRALALRTPIHLVIKSEHAKGKFSFVNHQRGISSVIDRVSSKHGIRLYKKAINFDHIHFIVVLSRVKSYAAWIRELTKEIVLLLSRKTKTSLRNFFTFRPYTKILTWGRQLKAVLEYLVLNEMEVFGLRPKKKTSNTNHPGASP